MNICFSQIRWRRGWQTEGVAPIHIIQVRAHFLTFIPNSFLMKISRIFQALLIPQYQGYNV